MSEVTRYFVRTNVRTIYDSWLGWAHSSRQLELGVDAKLTGRFKLIDGERMQVEVTVPHARLVTIEPKTLFARIKRYFFGDERVVADTTRNVFIDEDAFSWETIFVCNEGRDG